MGLFSKILDKLGLNKKAKEAEAAQAKALEEMAKKEAEARAKMGAQANKPATPGAAPAMNKPAAPVQGAPASVVSHAPAAPVAVSEVDVVKHLEELSAGKGLNWKVSIVDLLKLLDLDSDFESRKEMAVELGCPPDLMGDSAKMNVWLHKTVLKKIAENGGNIPQSLLD